MELKTLSDQDLVYKLKALISNERKILTEVLLHLQEMEVRKLFLKLGFSSLFDYAVKELGYSASQAFRRISAMRLLKELPEVEEKIELGTLNLTHLTKAQEYFKHEKEKYAPLSKEKKLDLLSHLETKSTREIEKIFAELSPETVSKEKTRALSGNQTEIKFTVSDTFIEKLQRFKGLDSHVQTNPTYVEVFERLLDLALKQKDPLRKNARELNSQNQNLSPSAPKVETQSTMKTQAAARPQSAAKTKTKTPNVCSRFIPAAIKTAIYKRDQGKCTYLHPETGKTCDSRFQIQIDHIHPVAKGGESHSENLRLLCRKHNLLAAEKAFGVSKMSGYVKH